MLLGAALVTAIGSYATYQVAQSHIQNQLAERSKLLASAINHSAMIAKNDADLQHVIEEVLKDNFDIRTIAVMTKDSQKLIASASAGETAFSANGDDHLFRELAEAIRAGEFGLHAENNRDLVLIAPLWHALSASDKHGEAGGHASAQSHQDAMPNMQHAMGSSPPTKAGKADHGHSSASANPDWVTQKLSKSDYRGGILLRVDRSDVIATMSKILWGLMPVSVIGVLAILVLAYMLLHYLVIFPISDIRHVMKRQQSGDHQARAVRQSTQEFDDVAIAFNGMIEAISESENQFRNLVLGSIQGVYIHRDWNLLFANPALAEIFGYHSPDEILALGNVGSLLAPDEHERLWGYKNARKKGEFAPDVYEARGVKKDGSMICAEFRITSVDWHGTAAMQCVVIDITDRKNAERELLVHRDHLQDMIENATRKLKINAEELKEALAKEQKLSKLQREFVSMASHEFRTPLAIIDTTAQRMKSRADKNQLTSGDAIQRVEKIREAVKRMTRLMDSTLTAARMEEGKIEIEIGPCDIGGLIREVSERQQEVDEEHIISCDLDGLPETIQADTGALEQVLANLLSNAVKYAPDAPEIEVKAQAEKDHVVISVRDHGLGIDEDDLNRIGERFFRARTSTGIAGTGIGFNLARNLVEMHEGTISVESKKGEGSTFTIRLPIAGPELEKQADSRVA